MNLKQDRKIKLSYEGKHKLYKENTPSPIRQIPHPHFLLGLNLQLKLNCFQNNDKIHLKLQDVETRKII